MIIQSHLPHIKQCLVGQRIQLFRGLHIPLQFRLGVASIYLKTITDGLQLTLQLLPLKLPHHPLGVSLQRPSLSQLLKIKLALELVLPASLIAILLIS
ncbi:MAG: hypothetical protein AAGB04_00050 [Pseudomonadota bacterium]